MWFNRFNLSLGIFISSKNSTVIQSDSFIFYYCNFNYSVRDDNCARILTILLKFLCAFVWLKLVDQTGSQRERLNERDMSIVSLYNQTAVLVLRHRPKSSTCSGAEIDVYPLNRWILKAEINIFVQLFKNLPWSEWMKGRVVRQTIYSSHVTHWFWQCVFVSSLGSESTITVNVKFGIDKWNRTLHHTIFKTCMQPNNAKIIWQKV